MSLILDALNRSESDRRDTGHLPGIQSRHGPDPGLPAWRRFLWPVLAILFALLALGLWLGGAGDDTAATPTPTSAPQAAVKVEPPPPRAAPAAPVKPVPASPVESAPVAAPAKPALDPDVAALYQQAPRPAAPVAEAPVAKAPAEVKPAPAAPALDVDAVANAAQAALDERAAVEEPLVEHAAPYITDLRQSIKDQIPSIFYNEHRWASNRGERSVVLNRKRYTEGQQIQPGLRLLEILPDSIVLDFNGTEFRLQSLNSWVNL